MATNWQVSVALVCFWQLQWGLKVRECKNRGSAWVFIPQSLSFYFLRKSPYCELVLLFGDLYAPNNNLCAYLEKLIHERSRSAEF